MCSFDPSFLCAVSTPLPFFRIPNLQVFNQSNGLYGASSGTGLELSKPCGLQLIDSKIVYKFSC